MKKPSILVTRILPPAVMQRLREIFQLDVNRDSRNLTPRELRQRAAKAEGILCLLTDRIDRTILTASDRLRIVANYAVGYNNIDLETARRCRIAVTNTPGVLTETTADLTFGLILAAARRIVEGDRMVRQGAFRGWEPTFLLGQDIHHQVIGIIGLGRIGRAVAQRALGFGMKILYYEVKRLSRAIEKKYHAQYRTLPDLLRESDIISVHLPLTAATRHLLARREFRMMKPGCVLVNTSRGPVVDERALVTALRRRQIAAAGLDVFENEPRLASGLTQLSNVVLTPHIGSASLETRTAMGMICLRNLRAVLIEKRPPPDLVNP